MTQAILTLVIYLVAWAFGAVVYGLWRIGARIIRSAIR